MKPHEFIEIYTQLTPENKERLDEAIQLRAEKLEQIAELEEKFKKLSAEQMADLEREEAEYLADVAQREREINQAEYVTEDPEEAASLQGMDWANLHDESQEVLVTTFPIGIQILETDVEHIDEKMIDLLPKMPRGRSS